jgi:autotransporter passenger strand-loop-strand repeat protein
MTIVSSGSFTISSGVTGAGIIVVGGFLDVFGTALDTQVVDPGEIVVEAGGVASSSIVSGFNALSLVNAGGRADGTVLSGAKQIVDGEAGHTEIDAGGIEYIEPGGNSNGGGFDVVNAGGEVFVFPGGAAFENTVNSGGEQVVEGGDDGSVIYRDGLEIVSSGATAFADELLGGELDANSGSLVSNTIIEAGGALIVAFGGTSVTPFIGAGGLLDLQPGASVIGAITFKERNGNLVDERGFPGNVINGFVPSDRIDFLEPIPDLFGIDLLQPNNVLPIGNLFSVSFDQFQNFAGQYFHLSSTQDSSGTFVHVTLAQRDLSGGSDFIGNGTSDILFRNDATGDLWYEAMSNGAPAGPNPWNHVGGSDTNYSVVGQGEFYGGATSGIFYRNNATGDTWFEAISNGFFSSWNHIGGSDPNYSVVGIGRFDNSIDTSDMLFRNNATGDTWFESDSGWFQVGGSNTNYAVAGVGDFYGNGTSDILFRNNSTGNIWLEVMNDGINNGGLSGVWDSIGGSDTHYSVVGVGDFNSDGTSDILFRNNATGDLWYEAMSNGAPAGPNPWNHVGGSDTNYAVVGIGDYFAQGTSDILFRNNATGDTWYIAMSNGAFNGWHQVGGSNTNYTVKT